MAMTLVEGWSGRGKVEDAWWENVCVSAGVRMSGQHIWCVSVGVTGCVQW